MILPQSLTTVTRLSKTIALILFIALPFLGFLLGMRWQETLDSQNKQLVIHEVVTPHPTPQPTQVQDETVNTEATRSANWKTYNGQYFSFKYPETWIEKPLSSQNPRYPFVGSMFLCSTSSIFSVTTSKISLYPTLESYLRMGRWTSASPTKTVMLDGLSANYYEDPGDPGSSNPSIDVVLYSQSKGIIVDLYFDNSCGESFQQIKKDSVSIISTFKFLE